MQRKNSIVTGLVCAANLFIGAVCAAESGQPDEIDLEYADEINVTCSGCHGEFGQGVANGTYPRLAGLDADYISRQLRLFKTHARVNIPMYPFATKRELPKEDVRLIAIYLSRIQLPTALPPAKKEGFDALARLKAAKKVLNIPRYPGNAKAGRKIYQKECANCHGRRGYGKSDKKAPRLTGQYSLYLLRQIKNFRKGERLHEQPEDAEVFREFSEDEIAAMLAFLSLQDDGAQEPKSKTVHK